MHNFNIKIESNEYNQQFCLRLGKSKSNITVSFIGDTQKYTHDIEDIIQKEVKQIFECFNHHTDWIYRHTIWISGLKEKIETNLIGKNITVTNINIQPEMTQERKNISIFSISDDLKNILFCFLNPKEAAQLTVAVKSIGCNPIYNAVLNLSRYKFDHIKKVLARYQNIEGFVLNTSFNEKDNTEILKLLATSSKKLKKINIYEEYTYQNSFNNLHMESVVKSFQGLQSLGLTVTSIDGAGLEHVAQLSQLTELNLKDNLIIDGWLEPLAKLTQLTILDLSSNRITGEGFKHLVSLNNLTTLNAGFNRIKGPGLEYLAQLKQLANLKINTSEIAITKLKYLATVTQLTTLDLSQNNIVGHALKNISQLTLLTNLDLSDNPIGSAKSGYSINVCKCLAQHPKLAILNLYRTELMDCDLKDIGMLSQLVELDLRGNKLTSAGISNINVAQLRKLTMLELEHKEQYHDITCSYGYFLQNER